MNTTILDSAVIQHFSISHCFATLLEFFLLLWRVRFRKLNTFTEALNINCVHSFCLTTIIHRHCLIQWFPKDGSRPKQESRRGRKWVAPRRFKPGLYISNVPTVSLCLSVDTWEKSRLLAQKTNLATVCKNHPYNRYFFHVKMRCLSLGSRDVHQTQIWVELKKVREPSLWSIAADDNRVDVTRR